MPEHRGGQDGRTFRARFTTAFDDVELEAFCFDYFRDVSIEYTVGMKLSQKVLILFGYCARHGYISELLKLAEAERPGIVGDWQKSYDEIANSTSIRSSSGGVGPIDTGVARIVYETDLEQPSFVEMEYIASHSFFTGSVIGTRLEPQWPQFASQRIYLELQSLVSNDVLKYPIFDGKLEIAIEITIYDEYGRRTERFIKNRSKKYEKAIYYRMSEEDRVNLPIGGSRVLNDLVRDGWKISELAGKMLFTKPPYRRDVRLYSYHYEPENIFLKDGLSEYYINCVGIHKDYANFTDGSVAKEMLTLEKY